MTCQIYEAGTLQEYTYVVVLSSYQGKLLLSRHQKRETWETQGGHVESGETPMEAAKRELYEESGATDFYIAPLCDYCAGGLGGMVFQAVIHELGKMPNSEMAEVRTFPTLPDNVTYPDITPVLFQFYKEREAATFPSVAVAKMMLEEAVGCNPGAWEMHSVHVANAARAVAGQCGGLDPDKAYVLGLLHDIGRRFGVSHLAHVYDGYHYLMALGYPEAAKVALSHSFNLQKLDDYIGKFDVAKEKQEEIAALLSGMTYDDYDYLIQLCDSIAKADGIVSLEERMNDVKGRYGYYPQEKWDRNIELKKYFEEKMGKELYQACLKS